MTLAELAERFPDASLIKGFFSVGPLDPDSKAGQGYLTFVDAVVVILWVSLMYPLWVYPILHGVKMAKRKGISPKWLWFGIHPVGGWVAYGIIWSKETVAAPASQPRLSVATSSHLEEDTPLPTEGMANAHDRPDVADKSKRLVRRAILLFGGSFLLYLILSLRGNIVIHFFAVFLFSLLVPLYLFVLRMRTDTQVRLAVRKWIIFITLAYCVATISVFISIQSYIAISERRAWERTSEGLLVTEVLAKAQKSNKQATLSANDFLNHGALVVFDPDFRLGGTQCSAPVYHRRDLDKKKHVPLTVLIVTHVEDVVQGIYHPVKPGETGGSSDYTFAFPKPDDVVGTMAALHLQVFRWPEGEYLGELNITGPPPPKRIEGYHLPGSRISGGPADINDWLDHLAREATPVTLTDEERQRASHWLKNLTHETTGEVERAGK